MKITKRLLSTTLGIALAATLTVSSNAHAVPGYAKAAPMSSVDICVAQISETANYADASRVRHNVETRPHRISSHRIIVDTTVFGADGDRVIREYATVCTVGTNKETTRFEIEEKVL